jgi:hypothetical protein
MSLGDFLGDESKMMHSYGSKRLIRDQGANYFFPFSHSKIGGGSSWADEMADLPTARKYQSGYIDHLLRNQITDKYFIY